MKISKPCFSKIQQDFLKKFTKWLKNEFGGEQLAVAEKLGCDQSQISRWVNKETAPPEYACRLLLKEMGVDTFNGKNQIVYMPYRQLKQLIREVTAKPCRLSITTFAARRTKRTTPYLAVFKNQTL